MHTLESLTPNNQVTACWRQYTGKSSKQHCWKMQTWGIINLQREVTLIKHYLKYLDRFKLFWHPCNVVPINQDYSIIVKSFSKSLDVKKQWATEVVAALPGITRQLLTETQMLNRIMLHNSHAVPSPDKSIKKTCVSLYSSSAITAPVSRKICQDSWDEISLQWQNTAFYFPLTCSTVYPFY